MRCRGHLPRWQKAKNRLGMTRGTTLRSTLVQLPWYKHDYLITRSRLERWLPTLAAHLLFGADLRSALRAFPIILHNTHIYLILRSSILKYIYSRCKGIERATLQERRSAGTRSFSLSGIGSFCQGTTSSTREIRNMISGIARAYFTMSYTSNSLTPKTRYTWI